MDERIILQKLESFARCIERLKSKKPSDIETFRTDHDLQDISEKNLPYRRQVMYVVFFVIYQKKMTGHMWSSISR